MESTTDEILGEASHQLTKGKVDMKYDHSDPEWGISPIKPVDYQKAHLDSTQMENLMEPIDMSPKKESVVELNVSWILINI